MKRGWLTGLFVLLFFGTVIATMPLSFVLERAGLRQAGLNWQHTKGTIFRGEIIGLSYGTQSLGSLGLNFVATDLFSARLGYQVDLNGPGMTGVSKVSLGRNKIIFKDLNGAADINRLAYFVNDVRSVGGQIELSDINIDFDTDEKNCTSASGRIVSNVLERFAAALAKQRAEDILGDIGCVAGALTLGMEGVTESEDRVTVDGVLSASDRSHLEIKVHTLDAVLGAGLELYGFEQRGEAYILRQEIVTIEGLING